MNRLIHAALAASTLAFAVPAFAGDPTPRTEPRTEQAAADPLNLKAELNLDEGTAERVQTILTTARDQQQTLRTQAKDAVADLRRAREGGEPQAMNTALDRLRGLHHRLKDLETETVDRVMANLTVQQQADFVLWIADKRQGRLLSDDQA